MRSEHAAEGIAIDSGNARGTRVRWMPTLPLWPGFAINTVSYAAIVWLLLAFPRALLHRIRALRGRCAACGYDLRGCIEPPESIVCPECGAPGEDSRTLAGQSRPITL
jgi:hypothetical protein